MAERQWRKESWRYLSCPLTPIPPMRNPNLEELVRLQTHLEAVELRLQDATRAMDMVYEEVRESRLAVTLLLENVKTLKEFGAESESQSWFVSAGIPS